MDTNFKLLISFISALIVILIVFLSFNNVDTGQIGIKTTFGAVSNEPLNAGLHFKLPFISTIHTINLRVATVKTTSEAASKDLQTVDTQIIVNYNITTKDPIQFFTRLGSDQATLENSIIQPAVNETFKAVVAQFTAEDLINKRDVVSQNIAALLTNKLASYDIQIDSISVTGFQFSEIFNQAIEAKVTAQQRVLTAQNDLQRIQVEAQQKIVEAEAQAKSMELQKQIVTPELISLKQLEIQKLAIEKWNGVLPMYTGNNLPFIMKN